MGIYTAAKRIQHSGLMIIPADHQRHQDNCQAHEYQNRYRNHDISRLVPVKSQCCQYRKPKLIKRKHAKRRSQKTARKYNCQKLYKEYDHHLFYRIPGCLHDGSVSHICHDKVFDTEMSQHQRYGKYDKRKKKYYSYENHGQYHCADLEHNIGQGIAQYSFKLRMLRRIPKIPFHILIIYILIQPRFFKMFFENNIGIFNVIPLYLKIRHRIIKGKLLIHLIRYVYKICPHIQRRTEESVLGKARNFKLIGIITDLDLQDIAFFKFHRHPCRQDRFIALHLSCINTYLLYASFLFV